METELKLYKQAHSALRNLYDMGYQSELYRLTILELERELPMLETYAAISELHAANLAVYADVAQASPDKPI